MRSMAPAERTSAACILPRISPMSKRGLTAISSPDPLNDAQGQAIGSLLVVEANDEDDACAFLAEDPYAAAGLWGTIHVAAFAAAAGTAVGGVTWK